jgi:DNA-binding MarR family transcriptional regulator
MIDLHQAVGHLIRRAFQQYDTIFLEESGDLGLTAPQFVLLSAVHRHSPIDQTRLAALVALDRATTGNILGRLEERGLVERRASAEDHRARIIALTDKGRKLQKRFDSIYAGCQGRVLDTMTPDEADEFLRLLCKFVKVAHRPYFTARKGKAPPARAKRRR